MKLQEGFEIINVADEHLVVPVGKQSETFQGILVLNEAAAYLLSYMKENTTQEKLVRILEEKYAVDREKASKDVKEMIKTLTEVGLLV